VKPDVSQPVDTAVKYKEKCVILITAKYIILITALLLVFQ
jgi:hypothetical protein